MTAVSGFILLVGLIRCITGTEYALSLFFLFPIAFSTWYAGLRAGVILSVFSTITWLAADLLLVGEFSDASIPFINETFRLIVFLFATVLVWEFKNALQAQQRLARMDPLTELSNRRAFFEVAEVEIYRAQRFCDPLSIIYMDIDNFKAVNDDLGHDAGDHLLQVVADTILKNIRSIDIAARFGGDELGILFSKTDANGAMTLAVKLNQKLKNKMRDYGWPVTFSMGVATFQNTVICVDDMLHVADKLMYSAKKNGKNRIMHQVFVGQPEKSPADNEIKLNPHF